MYNLDSLIKGGGSLMNNKVDVIDIFINQLKRSSNKDVAKEDIIRFAEEHGIAVNKRVAKSKVISSLKILGIIKEESKSDTYYNRANRDYYEMEIYPITILERYTSEELTRAYNQAYKQDEFRIRIETNKEEDVHKIISELSKVFIVEDDPAIYEKKGKGINSYLKIKIANNTKIEEYKYMQDVHKLKTELKMQQKKYDEIMQYAGLINRLKKEYELEERTELFSNVIRDVKSIKNKRASENRANQIKNKKNAGRKDKFTKEQKEEILNERKMGMTIRALAQKYDCGVATIHKLISECEK